MNLVWTIILGFALLVAFSESAMDVDVARLLTDLQQNYSKSVRPPRNQSEILTVQVGFSLIGIKEFDEIESKFSVIGTMVIGWIDERVTWDPDGYNGVYSILVENNVFWTPPIFMTNSIDELKKIGQDSYWTVRYLYSGQAFMYPDQSLDAACQAKVDKFPWDRQSCELFFSLIGYEASEIILVPYDSTDDSYFQPLANFIGDDLWDVESRSMGRIRNIVNVEYELKRKPLSSIINVLLPILLLSFLSIFVFLIPAESGERISFSLTVLLAIAVFLTLVSERMPKSATSIPILSYYLVVVLALSIAITICTIVNMKIYFWGEKKRVPKCLQAMTRCLLCKGRAVKYGTRHGYEHNGKSTQGSTDIEDRTDKVNTPRQPYSTTTNVKREAQYHVRPTWHVEYTSKRDHSELGQLKLRSKPPSSEFTRVSDHTSTEDGQDRLADEQDQRITWKTVSSAFDIIFFIVSIIGFTVSTVVFVVLARDNDS